MQIYTRAYKTGKSNIGEFCLSDFIGQRPFDPTKVLVNQAQRKKLRVRFYFLLMQRRNVKLESILLKVNKTITSLLKLTLHALP